MTRPKYVLFLYSNIVILASNLLSCFGDAHVNVGEPHLPISIASKGKVTICSQVLIDDGTTSVGDHDFNCVNFMPSVNLVVDIKARTNNADEGEALQNFTKV
jgi:hypothetical protein